MKYKVIIHEAEEGGYWAEVPSLPGCFSQGETFEEVKKKTNKDPREVFEKVMQNVVPLLEVKPRRVGGATYQIPVEVSRGRAQALAMQWIRRSSRERPGKSMVENLTAELIDAYNGVGAAIKKREDIHKVAEANRAFAHFRW